MSEVTNRHAGEKTSRAFSVRRPRAGDAIGGALRNAFGKDCALPDDMLSMLGMLDQKTSYAKTP